MDRKPPASFERLSKLATISGHERVLGMDRSIIEAKCLEAERNARKREILVLHRGDSDPLQRMLNALQPGSYVRPHRHSSPPKSESLALLTGSIGFIPFLDDGTPDTSNFVWLHPLHGALAVDCRENVWHTFFPLEPNTVVFEVKAGPYDPQREKEFAPWAPDESSTDAPAYQAWLEELFRRQFPSS